MTLEQTTRRILAAAEAQDLAALQSACEMRESALAELHSMRPTPWLCQDVTGSIAAGERAKQALRVVKQRIRNESRRLAHIEDEFVRALQPVGKHQIDCNG
jgi:hypothetical protein